MPDEMNDDFDIEDKDIDVPADAVEDTDDATDGDDDFDFTGLTQAEIDAINADDGEGDNQDDEDTETDTTDDSNAGDEGEANTDTTDSVDNADDAANQDDDFTQEAATVAEKRAAIDAEYDAQLAKLEELGNKWDEGEIGDGAYNAAKARLDRELERIKVRESELVTKEDAIAERETSQQEQFQNEWTVAVNSFMERPENEAFKNESSPEYAALDSQLGVIAKSMPPGTPFNVLLDKARQAVSSFMTLPEAGKPAPEKKKEEHGVMPSISSMPAVVANSNEGNKFAHLDKLDGPTLERALADMTPEQQAEYLNS